MMMVTQEEYMFAQFSLRMCAIFNAHNLCTKNLNPDLLKYLWKRAKAGQLVTIKHINKGVLDINIPEISHD